MNKELHIMLSLFSGIIFVTLVIITGINLPADNFFITFSWAAVCLLLLKCWIELVRVGGEEGTVSNKST